ncbi:MAG: heliorhodopsin HeR [Promethearchaeia archaeon]
MESKSEKEMKKTQNQDTPLDEAIEESKEPITYEYLKHFNRNAGILHLIQGILMVFLGTILDFAQDIYTLYTNFYMDPETFETEILPDPQLLFTFEALGIAVGSFLLISATFHLLIAYPLNKRYNEYMDREINPLRWLEYSVSSSIMIVLIALFFSVLSFWLLVAIFFLNFNMIMFGLMMELHNEYTEKTNWTGYILGWISGIIPWVIITAYFYGVSSNLGEGPPDFVYIIYWVEVILFNAFAFNMLLQYLKVGPWKDYLFGERVYIILSLVAKTLLAWLVFAGVFQPD